MSVKQDHSNTGSSTTTHRSLQSIKRGVQDHDPSGLSVTEKVPQAGFSSLFGCREVYGFLIDFKHRVIPDNGESRRRWFKVKYVICFPPGTESDIYGVKFEAVVGLTGFSMNAIC